jgi:hypothetical protein
MAKVEWKSRPVFLTTGGEETVLGLRESPSIPLIEVPCHLRYAGVCQMSMSTGMIGDRDSRQSPDLGRSGKIWLSRNSRGNGSKLTLSSC